MEKSFVFYTLNSVSKPEWVMRFLSRSPGKQQQKCSLRSFLATVERGIGFQTRCRTLFFSRMSLVKGAKGVEKWWHKNNVRKAHKRTLGTRPSSLALLKNAVPHILSPGHGGTVVRRKKVGYLGRKCSRSVIGTEMACCTL